MPASSVSRDTWQYAFMLDTKLSCPSAELCLGSCLSGSFLSCMLCSQLWDSQSLALVGRSIIIAIFVLMTASCYTGTFFKIGSSSVAAASGHVSISSQLRMKKEKKIARTMLFTVSMLALFYFPETITYPIL